jgi:anti-sigma B factor antagonist
MDVHPTTNAAVELLPGKSPETMILRLHGPLTIHNFFEFQDLTRKQNARVLLIDVTDVPYIDSAALGSLVGVHVSCENGKKRYAIIGPNDRLQKLFQVTSVSQFLITYPTVAEADAALG